MAEKKTAMKERMVTIKLDKAPKGENKEISASCNGKVYLIKRGIPVKVPESLAEIIMNSERARMEADAYSEEKQKEED